MAGARPVSMCNTGKIAVSVLRSHWASTYGLEGYDSVHNSLSTPVHFSPPSHSPQDPILHPDLTCLHSPLPISLTNRPKSLEQPGPGKDGTEFLPCSHNPSPSPPPLRSLQHPHPLPTMFPLRELWPPGPLGQEVTWRGRPWDEKGVGSERCPFPAPIEVLGVQVGWS